MDGEHIAPRERRRRARRALAEADAAVTRLHEARRRAEALLRRAAGELADTPDETDEAVAPEEALRARMRRIEDRMQEADSRMRLTESGVDRDAATTDGVRPRRDR